MRPSAYHGGLFEPPFFEGWYVKLVDREARDRLAVILGVFDDRAPEQSHAFVQLFDGRRGVSTDLKFSRTAFRASERSLDVSLGGARLDERRLSLDLDGEGVEPSLAGRIDFGPLTPWPVTLRSPGAMGWYGWMPFMECYHGVVSLDHELAGTLTWADRTYVFDGGRGYLEKDWGRSFPSSWIWLQCNHFGEPGTSLMGSLARIPWIRRSFPGFIVGLWHQDRLHRFATYTGAATKRFHVDGDDLEWILQDRRYELRIRGRRGPTTALRGPSFDGMSRTVDETLDGRVEVQLRRRGFRGGIRFEGVGAPAAMELHGDAAKLTDRARFRRTDAGFDSPDSSCERATPS